MGGFLYVLLNLISDFRKMDLKLAVFLGLFVKCCTAYRLDGSVVPEHYKLDIIANLGDVDDKYDFNGNVWIDIKCLHSTNNITLHAKELSINKKHICMSKTVNSYTTECDKENIASFSEDEANDFFSILLKEPLAENSAYQLLIPFRGQLKDVLSGFYRSSYTDNNTKNKTYLATTQFEATDARRAFPCFDEPAMKATFQINIGHTEKYNALSNMPQKAETPIEGREGWIWTQFQKTVPMSTYLVAFIVSDFASEETQSVSNVTFKIWARKSALDQVQFAKEVGPKALDYYEKYFNIRYPLPKQDMVAIPDFSAGAMENWGLITYRESVSLYDPKVSSSYSQQSVASVICHELAHQWFGNLVTMKWWTDLWLNEGFATYMASLAVHNLFPEWNSLDEEAALNLLSVFSFDSLRSSHPVSVPIGHPSEIDQIFDTISYKKGSHLIRMMNLFLGDDTFRKGVSNYLEMHRYGNAEQDDLWKALTDQAHSDERLLKNLTVKLVMDTWTLQTGYPVIQVNRIYGKHLVELRQERYLRDTIKVKSAPECWWVPISYTDDEVRDFNSTEAKYWLPCTGETQVVKGFVDSDDDWLLLNIQAAGLYRVNYDQKNWKLLIEAFKEDHEVIPLLNRVQLIDDSSYLAWSGYLGYDVFFNLIGYLTEEIEYLPWKAALKSIGSLNTQLKHTSNYGLFKEFMKYLLTPLYKKVGGFQTFQKNSLDQTKHQSQIVGLSCKFNVPGCVEDAKEIFEKFKTTPQNKDLIPKDLRSVIFCTAVKHGSETEWEFLWNQYLGSNVASEKSNILSTLGCTKEIWLLSRYLEWTIKNETGIRQQDYSTVFASVASNDVGYYIARKFVEENIKAIHKSLGANTRRLGRYISPLAEQMITELDYNELLTFVTNNKNLFKESKQAVDQAIETVRLNVQWQKTHAENINKLLREHQISRDEEASE